MKIERGIMIMKDGKGWGVSYDDGYSISYGWVDPEDANIYDSRFCRKPLDATHNGSLEAKELITGTLVYVEKRITMDFMTTENPLSTNITPNQTDEKLTQEIKDLKKELLRLKIDNHKKRTKQTKQIVSRKTYGLTKAFIPCKF